jgi:hypothetical protein
VGHFCQHLPIITGEVRSQTEKINEKHTSLINPEKSAQNCQTLPNPENLEKKKDIGHQPQFNSNEGRKDE